MRRSPLFGHAHCGSRRSGRSRAEVGVAFDDPVLVETSCPLPYGDFPSLTVMERAALPVLAPLAPQWGGESCNPGPDCLWFIDEEGSDGSSAAQSGDCASGSHGQQGTSIAGSRSWRWLRRESFGRWGRRDWFDVPNMRRGLSPI